ncbi:poly-beta-1,6-N-acetyl-D-glucosamine biosynthesis protein PgaD [Xenorhabdus sp. DI]|uniref:poly-beta-1,6-N-acetyl-D-glucosamine biosynthesis protein PgaD n=1 Tax=Xenorhabdus doucetiae TaxID=351671 RepID=UPI00198FE2C8|nr:MULTISPECIES: poly-beta-1,6-N-acetyl-D-glucosamine biosynthesis protein PgaD [unclassified Xenorhabdus]MBD2785147.1 poly-beta-1,6-N-acetyl-D-glucosamine biosynthesis protein PgaD [Xenorhabdus sp. 3]MBD2787360.1 poly-beta-1,6-N-acetyl-D-glucosamine biosynthesis protein PgaD [Xenorhabdus sp. DI]
MKDPLIFTEQKLSLRLIDILLTILAWVGFIYLFMVGLFNASHNITPYIVIAIINALLLIGWAKYNQHRFKIERRRHRPALTHAEVAQSFMLEQKLLDTLRQSKVSSISYDNHGHIIGINKDVST